MPYSIVTDHPDCEGFAVIKDATREVIGCHRTQAQAQDQLTAINIAEYGDRQIQEEVIERQDSYAPTASMQAEARRGLAWRRELGRGGTNIGLARARDIAGGKNLPLDTIRRMVSYFARHEVDKEAQGFRPGEDGYPSNGRIAWALWGGDAGKTWANRISKANETRLDHARNILDILRKSDID
jgi:hypothetical protein